MKSIVVYTSKTGFTKKYAQWIAEDLGCEAKGLNEISGENLADYDQVIYGGWIMGGMISGLDKIRNNNQKKLIVFGVGFNEPSEENTNTVRETNKLGDMPLFYLWGGTNPKKMGFMGRLMTKMVTKKTPVYEDHTSKESLKPMLDYVRSMR